MEECARIKTMLEMKDEQIFNSSWRLNQGYLSKDKISRTIITIFGEVKITRRRYFYHDDKKGKYVCLLGKDEGINRYERVHSHLRSEIAKMSADGKRYRNILEIYKHAKIS